jgi:hypothetical protein
VVLLHEYSRGIPRTINVLADNALLGGFATGQHRVTRQLVLDAGADFDLAVPKPALREESGSVKAPRAPDALSTSEKQMVDSAIPALPRSPRGRVEQIANWAVPAFSAFGFRKR